MPRTAIASLGVVEASRRLVPFLSTAMAVSFEFGMGFPPLVQEFLNLVELCFVAGFSEPHGCDAATHLAHLGC